MSDSATTNPILLAELKRQATQLPKSKRKQSSQGNKKYTELEPSYRRHPKLITELGEFSTPRTSADPGQRSGAVTRFDRKVPSAERAEYTDYNRETRTPKSPIVSTPSKPGKFRNT